MTVVGLDQITRSDVAAAGGKGANLGELMANDFPVPPGFVICADDYSTFMAEFDIPSNDNLPPAKHEFLKELRQKIVNKPLPESLSREIHERHLQLQQGTPGHLVYAVRSSATAEDLADASFAGQHDTYYYVYPDDLDDMVRKCWASLWSDEAFSYRQSQGIEHRDVDMAVIVQEMIRSDVSGITFTADPVSGSQSVIITESSWGMGAAIVDGRVSPDQYLVDKATHRLTSIRVSDKRFMVPAELTDGQHSRLVDVPLDLRRAETLNDDQVARIADLAHRAEKHFGGPQDIEWALHDDRLFFLQSRPITMMGEPEDEPEGRYILFKPVAENFTEPLMPLTLDVLRQLVPMAQPHYGRIYLKFEHVRALIPFKLSDRDIARLAYLSDIEATELRISWPRMIFLMLVLFINYLAMGVFYRRTSDLPDDFMESYRAYADRIADDDGIDVPEALKRLFFKYRFFEPAGNQVMLVNLVAPRYMLMLQLLKALISRWAPELPEESASLLCAGTDGVLSAEMGREILALAFLARQTESVKQTLVSMPPGQALAALKANPESTRFVEQLGFFLNRHGHRAPKEFELSAVRWAEDPSQVLGMVRNYLAVESSPDESAGQVLEKRQQLIERLRSSLSVKPLESLLQLRWRCLAALADRTRYYIKMRENSRFYHIMGFYAARRKVLKIEQRLLASGALKCKDDIYYLLWDEVRQLDQGKLEWRDVEDTIRTRRMKHIRQSKISPPKTIGFEMESPAVSASADVLSGQSASPGRYEGIARVIIDPSSNNEIQPGEILVAPYTDPAWTPLFLTARAAVVEVGSYLSHAGTVAREYGMPCVVDVAECTRRIKSGERILVDGSQGTVTLLTREHG